VRTVRFGSEAAKYGLAAGDKITSVLVPADRPSRYWFMIPALALLAIVVLLQLRRRRSQPQPAPAH
jgi:MYXO-CTERM domain-containing protein